MGLFEEPLKGIRQYLEEKRSLGKAREFHFTPVLPRASSPQVILSEDTGLELGSPGTASRSLLLWDDTEAVADGRITLVGPDFPEIGAGKAPLAQVVMVGGRFSDEYDCYRDLREATYNLGLRGFMTRVFPGRQSVWCRVSREAMQRGFNAQILGSALIQAVKRLDFVDAAEVLLVTSSREEIEELSPAADLVQEIVEALIKMYEEMNFDCDTCEYVEVCDSVVELRRIRDRLQAERGGGEADPG